MTTLKNNICNHILMKIVIVGCVARTCDQEQYPLEQGLLQFGLYAEKG